MNIHRRDYQRLASLLNSHWRQARDCEAGAVEALIEDMADLLAVGNKNYDRVRFLEACYKIGD